MGRKGKWFIAVKRVFSPESNEKKSQKTHKSKRKWKFGKPKYSYHSSEVVEKTSTDVFKPLPVPLNQGIKLAKVEDEQSKHAYSVALAGAVAAEAAAVAAQAAVEVVHLTTTTPATTTRLAGKSSEEAAAIKIQTTFRGFLARRSLQGLRGLVRLRALADGNTAKRQTVNTLHCMQTLSRVQSQIHSRRVRMREENQALQRQLQMKHERELEKLKIGEEWDDSLQSKEQIEANLLNKHEAAIRRERALAYAFCHQWKNSTRTVMPTFTDPNNPQWGWSWLERWMASRPWESRNMIDKDTTDYASMKGVNLSVAEQIVKLYDHRDAKLERTPTDFHKANCLTNRQSPLTPSSKLSFGGKKKSVSPRCGLFLGNDSRSMASFQSEPPRRQSIAGSSVRDDDSLASSPSIPSYMASTESARAKSRFQCPPDNKAETPEKGSVNSVKKRLSYPMTDEYMSSPARVRRHSGPPKVDAASLKEAAVRVEQVSNGENRQPRPSAVDESVW
ncbi:hypothetical protein Cni_G04222 [Canna indica]|uniref:DUF4005 domain-containing protein n=1 Tax=Canna indica TaxID=4628 RepID=A0AAQ3Q3S4_9LILI|nr:hypothetical protein Cni_G04222 [Canna indica]